MIDVEDFPQSLCKGPQRLTPDETANGAEGENSVSFEQHERDLLAQALERAGGNQSEAARILRISRDRMRYKMAKYNLR